MSNQIFNRKQTIKVAQSLHDLSHTVAGTMKPGYIYPIFASKVVPGDVFMCATGVDVNTQPFAAPLQNNVEMDIRYFYCRNLLLWQNFDEYIIGARRYLPGNTQNVQHVHPYIPTFTNSDLAGSAINIQNFFDWMYNIDKSFTDNPNRIDIADLDPLPARMYNLIFNEYYRSEFTSYVLAQVYNGDGNGSSDPYTAYFLKPATFKKDYYNTAFPWPQLSDSVAYPADVVFKPGEDTYQRWVNHVGDYQPALSSKDAEFLIRTAGENAMYGLDPNSGNDVLTEFDPNGTLGVSLDIRELRTANAIQRFLEKSAVHGNRYAEYMLAHFGVVVPDRSAFRPQYLGGGRSYINYSKVEQTSATDPKVSAQGNLAGLGHLKGIAGMKHKYLFTEYGWIMGLACIKPEPLYQGAPRKQFFVNGDRYENYYNPAFQNVGMDNIYQREINYPTYGSSHDPKHVWGYQEKYLDYKCINNSAHGDLVGDMNHWVAITGGGPVNYEVSINSTVVDIDPSCLDRNVAVADVDPFIVTFRNNILARRPMQYTAKYRF